jgi:flavorubredoxin
MEQALRALQITDHVWWVGVIDWDVRDFHGYLTGRGSTYNAYLIRGETTVLIDTVKKPGMAEMMARIASVIDPTDIDTIISNHSEMDHSGCLPEVIAAVRPEQVFASTMGVKTLPEHFDLAAEITPVRDGESLALGDIDLAFVETRMLHWPDSMMTYCAGDQVLFSSDGFGMHLASTERFADELDEAILEYEAGKYFANILLPFSPQVTKTLAKVAELDLPIQVIAPDHGPIWRQDPARIVALYGEWAEQKPTRKAAIVYDSMWQSTALMARAIAEGLAAGGASPRLLSARACHRSDIATEILDAGALLVGSPTLNNGIFPTVADAMTYLKGLKPQNLIGAAFGSFGWSGEAPGILEQMLAEMKVEIVSEPLKVKYVPSGEDLARCRELGETLAGKLASICDGTQ